MFFYSLTAIMCLLIFQRPLIWLTTKLLLSNCWAWMLPQCWFSGLWTNRKQRVKNKNVLSDWIGLGRGVPQGTITEPLTFLCMINDALSNKDHQVWKYIDDLTIGENRVRGTRCNLQPGLDRLSSWSQENKLKLNPTKLGNACALW